VLGITGVDGKCTSMKPSPVFAWSGSRVDLSARSRSHLQIEETSDLAHRGLMLLEMFRAGVGRVGYQHPTQYPDGRPKIAVKTIMNSQMSGKIILHSWPKNRSHVLHRALTVEQVSDTVRGTD